jgi:hypothetical protein
MKKSIRIHSDYGTAVLSVSSDVITALGPENELWSYATADDLQTFANTLGGLPCASVAAATTNEAVKKRHSQLEDKVTAHVSKAGEAIGIASSLGLTSTRIFCEDARIPAENQVIVSGVLNALLAKGYTVYAYGLRITINW